MPRKINKTKLDKILQMKGKQLEDDNKIKVKHTFEVNKKDAKTGKMDSSAMI